MAADFPSAWKLMPLSDCMSAIIDYRGKTPEKASTGIPLITAKIVKNGRIETPEEFVDPAEYDDWMRRGLPERGDVLITTEAPLGEVAQLNKSKVALAQRLIALRGKPGLLDNTFLKFLVQSNFVQGQLQARASGTTVLGIKQSELRRVSLILPELHEQQAIACILGAFDDKIELNRRMNRTLEEMAQGIFESWFVDFDPVRAKAAGRQPAGLAPAIADLFPDEFEQYDLGKIPEGWREGTVGEDFNITMGQSPPGSTYNEEGDGVPFYQGRRDFEFRYPAVRVYCTAPKRFAKSGDTLVSVRAPVGDINMAVEDCCVGRGVAAVRHKTGSRSYTYYAMKSLRSLFDRFEAEGIVFGSINKRDFHNLPFVVPPVEVVERFEQQVFPIDQLIETDERQIQTLADLRDTLLPKLISGELRVPDAERLVEENL